MKTYLIMEVNVFKVLISASDVSSVQEEAPSWVWSKTGPDVAKRKIHGLVPESLAIHFIEWTIQTVSVTINII